MRRFNIRRVGEFYGATEGNSSVGKLKNPKFLGPDASEFGFFNCEVSLKCFEFCIGMNFRETEFYLLGILGDADIFGKLRIFGN